MMCAVLALLVTGLFEQPYVVASTSLLTGAGLGWLWSRQLPRFNRDPAHRADIAFLVRLLGWEELVWGALFGALVFAEAQIGLFLRLLEPVLPRVAEDWARKHAAEIGAALTGGATVLLLAAQSNWLQRWEWLPLLGYWRRLLLATAGTLGLVAWHAGWLLIDLLTADLPAAVGMGNTLLCRSAAALLTLDALLFTGTMILGIAGPARGKGKTP